MSIPRLARTFGVLALPVVGATARAASAHPARGATPRASAAGSARVTAALDLALAMDGPDSLAVGGAAAWALTVTNVGTVPTTGTITLVDTLPTGVAFGSAAGSAFTCAANGLVVTCVRTGPLGPGESAMVAVAVTVTGAPGVAARNAACVATAGDANAANDCAAKTSTTSGTVDLGISKVLDGTLAVGTRGRFTIAVSSLGTVTALPPIRVTDSLPTGLLYVSATGAGWQCTAVANDLTCTRSTALLTGEAASITVDVNVTAAAVPGVINCALVRGVNETESPANNRACVTATVAGTPVLDIAKVASRREAGIGDVVEYTVVVRNTGNGDVEDAVITDLLPVGVLLDARSVRVDGVAGIVTGAPGPRVTIGVGRLAAGRQATATYRVRVGPGARRGDNVNVAIASSAATGAQSAPARATVRVAGGVFDERGVIAGKVFAQCDCGGDRMPGAAEVGIPGVRVYLEDGTSAVTDVEGKYAFPGVSSRLHVVKVDRVTLPEGAALVPLGSRNAGDGYTRFADVKAGELHRADFAEGSRSREVLDRVLERRRGGEVENAGERPVPSSWPGHQPANLPPPRDTLRGEARAAYDLQRDTGLRGASMYATRPVYPRGTSGGAQTGAYVPLLGPHTLDDANAQLPVNPLQARAAQRAIWPAAGRVEVDAQPIGLPADGQTLVPIYIHVFDAAGAQVRGPVTATLESSVGRWLDTGPLQTQTEGWSVTIRDGVGRFFLVAPPSAARGEVRVTTSYGEATIPIVFAPSMRDLLVTGLVNARLDFLQLVRGNLGVGATSDGFEEALRDWSFTGDSADARGGARAAILVKGTVLDDRLITLSYDSERDRGRTFFRDIRPDESFPVFGDASIRDFDAQSRRRFHARLDKGTSYTMFGDFQTTRADDRRLLTSYDRALTGGVQHVEGRSGTATIFASQGRISQAVDEIGGRGISGPYALSRNTGLGNSERVEIIVRDRNQPSLILSRTPMTRFADYTIEPVAGRLLFRAPVPSADANLNPVSIRVTYETEDGRNDAFWVYGIDGSLRAGASLELGGTFARDEGPASSHLLAGVNATARLGRTTTLLAEYARTEDAAGTTGDAQRVELRHHSASLGGRVFAVRSDDRFSNQSSVFSGGRSEIGGRFAARLAARTRLIGEAIRTGTSGSGIVDLRRRGALLSIEHRFSRALRGELGFRHARQDAPGLATGDSLTGTPGRDVNALRALAQWTLPEQARTSIFGEVEQDVRDAGQRRLAVGGEYVIATRARLYGRHEFLTGLANPWAPSTGGDRNHTVLGVDADYLRNAQVFSEYRVRDAIAGRDAEASIGLRNRWALAPGLHVNTSFERVSSASTPVAPGGASSALATTGAIEWTGASRWKGTARLEYRDASDGDNVLASLGYVRKLSRDWTLLARTLWDDLDARHRVTRGFSQLGVAWRETDRNRWNALARYENRFERTTAADSTATRQLAHVLAALVNYQPASRITLSGRYGARWSTSRVDGSVGAGAAQLIMGRALLDLTSRLDAGVISSVLFADGFADRRHGAGAEAGFLLVRNLRVAGGYNVFGFDERGLGTPGTTRRGPYLELGFKFDESLFGIGGGDGPPRDAGGSRAKRE